MGRADRSPLERASVGDLDAETVERFIATSEAIRRAVVERGRPAPDDARRGAHQRAGVDPRPEAGGTDIKAVGNRKEEVRT
jgi:hypothetical protein